MESPCKWGLEGCVEVFQVSRGIFEECVLRDGHLEGSGVLRSSAYLRLRV